uniref:Uncharacterized protein n=1 Tax=Arion vulgaris TaxID=1028688 RepID=A0A0B7A357_9EUPU
MSRVSVDVCDSTVVVGGRDAETICYVYLSMCVTARWSVVEVQKLSMCIIIFLD